MRSAPARMSSAPWEATKKLEHVWMHIIPDDVKLLCRKGVKGHQRAHFS